MASSPLVALRASTALAALAFTGLARAAEPGPDAIPVDVVDVQTADAPEQARALTQALRGAIRKMPGWSLGAAEHADGSLQCAFPTRRPRHWSDVPPARDPEKARSLVYGGDDKLRVGNLGGALADYQAGDDIMRMPTTGVSVVRALSALGRFAEAADFARWVAGEPVQPNEAAVVADARREAAELAQNAAKRAASVKIVIDGAPIDGTVAVFADGVLAPPGPDASLRLVNPGKHALTVAPLGYRGSASVTAREGERVTVAVSLAEDPPTEACQSRIADAIKADHWIWGTLKRDKQRGSLAGDLHLWARGKGVSHRSFEIAVPDGDRSDEAWRRLATESLEKLTSAPPKGAVHGSPEPDGGSMSGRRIGGIVSLGAAGVLGVVGLIAGAEVLRATKQLRADTALDLERQPDTFDVCKPSTYGQHVPSALDQSAYTNKYGGICRRGKALQLTQAVVFPAAAVAVGVGIFLVVTGGKTAPSSGKTGWTVLPIVGPTGGAIEVGRRF